MTIGTMWIASWPDLLGTAAVGVAAYATLLVVLRISGNRTLSQLNAFDLVVTVALGSVLATTLLSPDTSWSQGALALIVLIGLQFVIALATSRRPGLRRIVAVRPRVLLEDGRFDREGLRAARLTEAEVRQAVRASGQGDVSAIALAVLESDGTISVVPRPALGDGSALRGLRD